jgi:hypothetical protein
MEFYNFHPDKIKTIALYTTGRASSVFFQGLLSGHPNIITTPVFGEYPSDSLIIEPKDELAKKCYEIYVVWATKHNLNIKPPFTFEHFKKPFMDYLDKFGISKKTVYLAIHYSLATLIGKKIEETKYILHHAHMFSTNLEWYDVNLSFLKDFKPEYYIFLTRDPRSTYLSVKKISNSVNKTQRMLLHKNWNFDLEFYKIVKKYKKTIIVRHEDLHCNFEKTINNVEEFLSLPDNFFTHESTFFGVPYDGKFGTTNRNGIFLNRPSSSYVNEDWKIQLPSNELISLQKISSKYMEEFDYAPCETQGVTEESLKFSDRISAHRKILLQGGLGLTHSIAEFTEKISLIPFIGNVLGESVYTFFVFSQSYFTYLKTNLNLLEINRLFKNKAI